MKRKLWALMLVLVLVFSVVLVAVFIYFAAQTHSGSSGVTILPDGRVEGASVIQREGDVYTFTGNLSCSVYVQRSDVVIDGAGYAINGGTIDLTNNHGVDPSRDQITNVTVKNLKIVNSGTAIHFIPSANDTFIGNYITNCYIGFNIWCTHNHTLINNTIENCVTGITISFGGSGNVIKENNIVNSTVFVMEQCPDNTVDRNYWSDYTTRYPNATEIGDTGIWDTPYEGREAFTDYQPRVEPVAVALDFPDEPFPTILVAVPLAAAITGVIILVYYKKRKRLTESDQLRD